MMLCCAGSSPASLRSPSSRLPQRRRPSRRGIEYVYADVRKLPFADSAFDVVACISTLEHIGMDNTRYGGAARAHGDVGTETRAAFAELLRVLAPGGTLYASVPFGAREDHGWLRQLDQADLDDLLGVAEPGNASFVYAYSRKGWQLTPPESAADSRYRDPGTARSVAADFAVAARAVACMRVRRALSNEAVGSIASP